jgi:bacterioferritin (cytochrome b1)
MRSNKPAPGATSGRQELVEELNRLMAEEAEASLRYFHMRFRLRDHDYAAAQAFFEEAIKETMDHATTIAEQIRSLGHVPTLRVKLALGGGSIRLSDALAEALDLEQQALEAYQDLLPRVAGDPLLEPFIRRQVEIETEHVEEIRAFIRTQSLVKLVRHEEVT